MRYGNTRAYAHVTLSVIENWLINKQLWSELFFVTMFDAYNWDILN